MKTLLRGKGMLLVLAVVLALALAIAVAVREGAKPPVRIGVLHSLTGTMAVSETPLVDAVRLAVDEANQSGGVAGRQIEIVTVDCRSDAAYCASEAERLISKESVQALFGCWTSSCRKAVKPVIEKHHSLLFYPLQYEGLEASPNIVYTGAAPNQQITPMVLWALQQGGKRAYLIGSDYVYPRTANRLVKELLQVQRAQLSGERYLPLGTSDMSAVLRDIATQAPDFVVNTLNGESNRHFFKALHDAGISAEKLPVFSTSIAEVELAAMGPELVAGHYAAWSYFQSVDNPVNKDFVARFKQRFGPQRVVSDPMEASYIGAKLWIDAVRELGSSDPQLVMNQLVRDTQQAPEGIVSVDPVTRHLWKTVRIGKARQDGQFDVIWQSRHEIRPAPFLFYRTRSARALTAPLLQEGVR